MIVFEEKMRDLIALLPQHNGFTVRYDWGSQDVLNKSLLLKSTQNKYPLIWLVNNTVTYDRISNKSRSKTRLVFATQTDDKDQLNNFQYKTSYSNILIPVYENFIKLMDRSGITTIIGSDSEYQLRPNYSVNENGKGLITIWNALVLDIEIEIQGNNCINTIKF